MIVTDLIIVLLLTVLNGILALSELAVVSSRRARLEQMAADGSRGAKLALRLQADPGRFLSTVQIGITLVGIFAGAFSGATLAGRLGAWLDQFALLAPHGQTIAFVTVVVGITYLSLIIGELVPKRVAMTNPERFASVMAGPMHILSRLASPAVYLLQLSSDAVLRLIGMQGVREAGVTEEEIKIMIAEGTKTGVFVPEERAMIEGVLRLADRSVRAIMTPRTDIVWIDSKATPDDIRQVLQAQRLSRLLVCAGGIDHPLGIVHTKDLLPKALRGEAIDLKASMMPVPLVLDRTPVLKLLDILRGAGVHLAVIVDEYGTIAGVVSLTDVLESIAGALPEHGEETDIGIVQRDDGSWLVDGALPIDEFAAYFHLRDLATDRFHTAAGFALDQMGRLPRPGDRFTYGDLVCEIVDLDGRRIDKILIHRTNGTLGGTSDKRQDG